MDFEKIQRSMEFVLAQRAQFVADLQQSREESDRRHAELSRGLTRAERALAGLTAVGGILVESIEKLTENQDQLAENIEKLSENHEKLGLRLAEVVESHAKTEVSLTRLGDAQRVTEASLNALILTVERHFREDHGGHEGRDQP